MLLRGRHHNYLERTGDRTPPATPPNTTTDHDDDDGLNHHQDDIQHPNPPRSINQHSSRSPAANQQPDPPSPLHPPDQLENQQTTRRDRQNSPPNPIECTNPSPTNVPLTRHEDIDIRHRLSAEEPLPDPTSGSVQQQKWRAELDRIAEDDLEGLEAFLEAFIRFATEGQGANTPNAPLKRPITVWTKSKPALTPQTIKTGV